jgi:hypothetical protein
MEGGRTGDDAPMIERKMKNVFKLRKRWKVDALVTMRR